MTPARRASIAALPALLLLAGCAAGVTPPTFHTTASLVARAPACPEPGSLQRSGKASAPVVAASAVAGGAAIHVTWIVSFANLTKTELENRPRFVAVLRACGASGKPVGALGNVSSVTLSGSCHNGACSATDTYERSYDPPTTRNRAFKYDLINFRPATPQRPYGFMRGVRILVKRSNAS